jgi:hypothetical protein
MKFAGEVIRLSVGEIYKQDPDIDLLELQNLAKGYNGLNGNSLLTDAQMGTEYSSECAWNDFMIDVLDWEWKSINSEYWTKRANKYGSELLYEEEWGVVKDTEKRKTEVYDIHVVYKGQWVIGTDIILISVFSMTFPGQRVKKLHFPIIFINMTIRPLFSLLSLAYTR